MKFLIYIYIIIYYIFPNLINKLQFLIYYLLLNFLKYIINLNNLKSSILFSLSKIKKNYCSKYYISADINY